MAGAEDRYVFNVEWFDSQADVIRRYMLTCYPRDCTIEMYDPKAKRAFLKRSQYPDVKLCDLYIGAVVTILSRQLKVIGYADDYSRRNLEDRKGRTFCLVKPDGYNHMGTVIHAATQGGFEIARLAMVRMSPEQAKQFLHAAFGKEYSDEDVEHLTSDVVLAMELVGNDAVNVWQAIIGPESPWKAQEEAPRSLRALIGIDDVKNAVHGSRSCSHAKKEIDLFFGEGKNWPSTALFNNCTLCIVRPHAFHVAGEIVSRILAEEFEISAMRLFHMDKATAEEFLEVYKGVLPEYHESCGQLCTGPCLVMEVRQEQAVDSFRKLVGPHDPEVAKHLRPNTIRAQFGVDRVRNAVHCTDLPEDGLLEAEYFFNILQSRK